MATRHTINATSLRIIGHWNRRAKCEIPWHRCAPSPGARISPCAVCRHPLIASWCPAGFLWIRRGSGRSLASSSHWGCDKMQQRARSSARKLMLHKRWAGSVLVTFQSWARQYAEWPITGEDYRQQSWLIPIHTRWWVCAQTGKAFTSFINTSAGKQCNNQFNTFEQKGLL